MPNTEDRQVLRSLELIARVRPSRECTQRALDRVRTQLVTGQAAGPSIGPRILRLVRSSPAVRAALAACLVAAVTVTLVLSRARTPVVPPVAMDSAPQGAGAAPDVPQVAGNVQTQLDRVEALHAALDADGLMGVLGSGVFEAQVAAARHLADLREPRAVEALARLAGQWTGDGDSNPFEQALQRILDQEGPATAQVARAVDAAAPTGADTLVRVAAQPALSGLVTDLRTGLPIPNAEILIAGPQVYLARTNTQGSYSLDAVEQAGDYRVQVQSAQYLGLDPQDPCGFVSLGPREPVVRDIQLEQGCRVPVAVVDEQGAPVPDVRLSAHWLGSDQGDDACPPATTGEDGRATMGALRPSAVPYQIAVVSTDYALQYGVVTCSDPALEDPVQITLHRGTPVQGRALYADGTPAQGLQVYAVPDWWHAAALPPPSPVDASGGFVLGQVQDGLFNLQVSIPQGDGLAYSFRAAQAQLPTADGQPLVVTIPQQAAPRDLARLGGTLLWSGDRRPDSVLVTAYSFPGTIASARLGPGAETFALNGIRPGLYTLVFEGPNIEDRVIQGVQVPGPDLEVDLQVVPTPSFRGIVLKARSNKPVERFHVAATKIRSWPGFTYLPQVEWHPVTDPNGVFEIASSGPGLYEVQVRAEGFVPAVLDRVDTRRPRQLVVELPTGGRIQGRVVDAHGESIAGASVSPVGTGQPRAQTQDGAFVLEHVPAGLHTLRVTHPQFSPATVEGVETLEGRTTDGVTVILHPGGAIEGIVYDPQGRPEANVALTVHDGDLPDGLETEAGLLATAITDAQGHYRVDRLPATLCFVQRRHTEARPGVIRRAVWPLDGRTIRLDLGGRPNVSGVLAMEGRPTPEAQVLLADASSPASGTFQCRAATDSDGSFTFNGVPAGRYGVYAQGEDEGTSWVKVRTLDVGTDDLDVGTLPGTMGRVEVLLTRRGADAPLDWTVHLLEGGAFWGQRIGQAQAPAQAGQPYRITRVLPGSYLLVAQGPEGTPDAGRRVTRLLDCPDAAAPVAVALEIPSGTASVNGGVLNEMGGPLWVFNQTQTLSVRVEPLGGYYRIANLPEGDYFVGSPYLLDKAPLARFHLAEGEAKILDINTWQWPGANHGLLSVQVASTSGSPLSNAAVVLEGPDGQIRPWVQTDREQVLIAPAGDYTLRVSQPGFQAEQRPVAIQANDLLALVPVRPVIQVLLEPEPTPSNRP
ncbi:MAG: carboxypeptidase regulatory-like domain-containing protein [Phycisphaerae bacterium]|nr:carboxypeptidase regulatory-like domain-containing protein [Phycisphaerae bacterium]